MTTNGLQLSLFDQLPTGSEAAPPEPEPAKSGSLPVEPAPIDRARAAGQPLSAQSSLSAAVEAYREHMEKSALSPHTVKSFFYDLNILMEFATPARPIGQIAYRDLENFIDWLLHDRGVPCNAKSLSRRITTLKAFFKWLAESNVIASDPAAPITQRPVSTPLPDILTDAQIEEVLAVAQQLRHQADKPDVRPYLLITLLLKTGIKKNECMALSLEHIDRSNPDEPVVWIRYQDPRYHHKERKLKLDPKWPVVLDEYCQQYGIQQALFPCTARNLEYILADISKRANLPQQLSFEMLRWTCAVRDRREGMAEETLRHKLGLSEERWYEAWPKIEKLAAPAV
ncbi:MAG: site-specific integrase [Chloroflexi bacterium]|nr:site-specific integrase [Chloroflexota bacterium]